jgi:hypothetical protein
MWAYYAHNICGTITPTTYVGLPCPQYMWAYYTCGLLILYVGLLRPQHMWAYHAHNICRPTVHVVPPYTWAYYTCGTTIHVNLLYNASTVHEGPQYMQAYYIHVGPTYMRAYYPYGLLYMWAHYTCETTVHEGPQYMQAYYTCIGGLHV